MYTNVELLFLLALLLPPLAVVAGVATVALIRTAGAARRSDRAIAHVQA